MACRRRFISKSVILSALVRLPLYPRMDIMHVLRRSNRSRRLINDITSLYLWSVLWLIFSARCLKNLSASPPMPPVVLKTKGVNVAFSTFNTLWLYEFFLACSCDRYICMMLLLLLDWAWGCNTLISVNVLSNGVQKPLALTSNLAPSATFVPWGRFSVVMLMSDGSISTSLLTCCTEALLSCFSRNHALMRHSHLSYM